MKKKGSFFKCLVIFFGFTFVLSVFSGLTSQTKVQSDKDSNIAPDAIVFQDRVLRF